jgi:hypothetical protein
MITMKYREFLAATLISAVPLQVALAAGADQSLSLLKQLHAQLEKTHWSSAQTPRGDTPRPDLAPLIGVDRRQLALGFGKPDFCATPGTEICDRSTRWSYFFYPFQSPSVRTALPGTVEVKISPGWGGWAVEVGFSKNGVVDVASWVKQE